MKIDEWSVENSIDALLKDIPTPGGNLDGITFMLRKAEIKIQQEQIRLAGCANELNRKLLISNEQASKQSERNAELMNNATQELAKSTKSLKWATWVLVGFTAVQALIALAELFKR
jgi:hypothetical protein